MESRAQVILDRRAQHKQVPEDMARVADYCFKNGGVSLHHHLSDCSFERYYIFLPTLCIQVWLSNKSASPYIALLSTARSKILL